MSALNDIQQEIMLFFNPSLGDLNVSPAALSGELLPVRPGDIQAPDAMNSDWNCIYISN